MTRPLWMLSEVIAASDGELDPAAEAGDAATTAITGVSIDTRSLESGDLFVPLTDTRDGHAFVTTAFERGAAAALVRTSYQRRPGDGALIRTDDPLRALEHIGAAARARLSDKARVIAVTGSAGKTGTKEMLRACLRACVSSPEKVHAPEKSFNNHWGVPLTLARMPAGTEFAVFEIGMNHAGEIRPLTKLVRPHIAIVTNVLPVHVGNFDDGEIGIANAKAEIFEGLEACSGAIAPLDSEASRPLAPSHGGKRAGGGGMAGLDARELSAPLDPARRGTAILRKDSPHFRALARAALQRGSAVLTFAVSEPADLQLCGVEATAEGAQRIEARFGPGVRWPDDLDESITFDMAMLGEHLAANALAVILALRTCGCDLDRALPALAEVRSAAGRGAREMIGAASSNRILLLDESYNANPASMTAALTNLAAAPTSGRRIAVLGDMLELGTDAIRYHVGLKAAAERADLVLCCGPNMRHLHDALAPDTRGGWASSSTDLVPRVLATLRPGDTVMVKGSLGSRMAAIVEAIRKRFSGD